MGRRRRIRRRSSYRPYFRYFRFDTDWNWTQWLWQFHPLILMVIVAAGTSLFVIHGLEQRMRPVLHTVAETQVKTAVTQRVEQAVAQDLEARQFTYQDMVEIQRNAAGEITVLSCDMGKLNGLRVQLVEEILADLDDLDEETIQVPLGSLLRTELLFGRGPNVNVKSYTVGTIAAEFESDVTNAGVNQTLHRIWLNLTVPLNILLPSIQLETQVQTRICIAETVIVGQVPNVITGGLGTE